MEKNRAIKFFSMFYGGEHHIPGEIKKWGPGWSVNHYGELSTFDFNQITRLVVMAHDFCIRVSISACNPSMVRIILHEREREGGLMLGHPTLEDHVKMIRESGSAYKELVHLLTKEPVETK